MFIRSLLGLFLACGILSAQAEPTREQSIGINLGECQQELPDRSAVFAALYSEGYRDARNTDGRLATRMPRWQSQGLRFRLLGLDAGRNVRPQVEFNFGITSLDSEVESTGRLRAIVSIRDCESGITHASVSRPVVRQYPGMTSATSFGFTTPLPPKPGRFVLVGAVAIVEEGCAPVLLGEHAEHIEIRPSVSKEELRTALSGAVNREPGAVTEVARECIARMDVDAATLQTLAEFHGIHILDLSMRPLNDECLRHLGSVSSLKELSVRGTAFTEGTISALSACRELECLNLGESYVSPRVFSALNQLPSLTSLKLAGCSFAAKDIHLLAMMNSLVELDLSQTPISDRDIEILSALTGLRKLSLARTQISAAGIEQLRSLRKLESLDLTGTALGNSDLDVVLALPALKELGIAGTRVSGDKLREKLQKSNVTRLILDSNQRTQARVQEINCEVLLSD